MVEEKCLPEQVQNMKGRTRSDNIILISLVGWLTLKAQ